MGTIADKLNQTLETKAALRAAIQAKGVEVADTDPFSSYPDKVRAIKGGGGGDAADIQSYLDGACIDFAATAGENTLHLREQEGGFDCTIHWGDGTDTAVPLNGGNVTHDYAQAGVYRIYITGKSFAGFCVNGQEGCEKYVALYSMGKWEVDTMTSAEGAFRGCVGLTSLPGDLFRYNTEITIFSTTFAECTGLTSLPGDLFRYNRKVTKFTSVFNFCTGLKNVPGDIFRYNEAVEFFAGVFGGCSALTEVPENLFSYNVNATAFAGCFSDCTALKLNENIFGRDLQTRFAGKTTLNFSRAFNRSAYSGEAGKAPPLWEIPVSAGMSITKTKCFGGAGNSAESLENYDDIPSGWK